MRTESLQQKYLNEVFGLNDGELGLVKSELERKDLNFMSISGAEARTLQFLIQANRMNKIVEIGTLYGYSALAMAKVLPKSGRVFTLEKNPENYAVAKGFFDRFEVGKKISAHLGDAQEVLTSLETDGPFDLVFIDADKAGYARYLDWAEKNVKSGGFIVGDNTFLWGGVWDQPTATDVGPKQIAAMKEFNQRLADQTKYNSILIPSQEGMTIAQKLF